MQPKNIFLYASLLMLLLGGTAYGQSTDQNYVMQRIPRKPISTVSELDGLMTDKASVMTTVSYTDGLGRPMQTVQRQASPGGKDIVQAFSYDEFGRERNKYLPFALTATTGYGAYVPNGESFGVFNFYNPSPVPSPVQYQQNNGIVRTTKPLSVTGFEASPLNRVVEQGAPGEPWQLPDAGSPNSVWHTVKADYSANDQSTFTASTIIDNPGSHQVSRYQATILAGDARQLTRPGMYETGQLFITINKNENWKPGDGCIGTVEEYKDKNGHVILKRLYNKTKDGSNNDVVEMLSTYYVYDDLGNLAFVLAPKANPDAGLTSAANQTTLDNLCYQYRYDGRNRLTQKKLPGKGWEFFVYNKLDQVILTQDGLQRYRTPQDWKFIKYDAQGREVMTGIYPIAASSPDGSISNPNRTWLTSLQSTADSEVNLWESRDGSNATTGYTNVAMPQGTVLAYFSINYYDDYSFTKPSAYSAPAGASTHTQGALTGNKTGVLGSTTRMHWTVNYYDEDGRNAKTYKQHNLGGSTPTGNNYDAVTTTYDFTDAITTTTRQHFTTASSGTPQLTITNTYYYDHMGRKLSNWQQMKVQALAADTKTLLSKLEYNEIGQVWKKHLGSTDSTAYLQDLTQTYNARGWLRTATTSGNLFNLDLRYDAPDAGIEQQYNGNIAQMLYYSPTANSRAFHYSYDAMNRLLKAQSGSGLMDETIAYDKADNITTLIRTGQTYGTLNYTYNNGGLSNQLATVTGTGFTSRSYTYEMNGNAKSNGEDKLISYNRINLPATVTQNGTTITTYTYLASGEKVRNVSINEAALDYIGGIVYQNGIIKFVQTEEGRAVPNGTGIYKYQYDLKDHLGNTRVTFEKGMSGNANPIQEDDYYAFGLHSLVYDNSNDNRYLYNGKEIQKDLTNQYDYGARFYDPVIARWGGVDPLAEQDRRSNPYCYGFNNPIVIVDPDGMFGDYYSESGQWLGTDGIDDDAAYVAKEGSYKKSETGYHIATSGITKLEIGNAELLQKAATVYGESSAYRTKGMTQELKEEMYAIASVHERNSIAYGSTSELAGLFAQASPQDRNGTRKQLAIGAEINAVTGGFDYSYGATKWDGIEQAQFKASDQRYSTGRFELHKNTQGWSISDSDYKAWKSYANKNGFAFHAPQVNKSIKGTFNRHKIAGGQIGMHSTTVHGGTIFWK